MIKFDIQKTQEFRHHLHSFLCCLDEQWDEVTNRWKTLQNCWDDNQYDKFEPEFEKLSSEYKRAKQQCEHYIIFLGKIIDEAKSATTISEYLMTGVTFISAATSLINSEPISNSPIPTAPTSSYVQQVPVQPDPLCSRMDESTANLTPEQKAATEKFNAQPQFVRPMSFKDQLDEVASKNMEEDMEEDIERRRREQEKNQIY
jgi:hypothetical protein